MISQIFDVANITFSDNYYGKKIQSLVNAYGLDYSFSRLYKCDNGYFHVYNSSIVIDISENNSEEIFEFIKMSKPGSIEVSSDIALQLECDYNIKTRTLFNAISSKNNTIRDCVKANTLLDDVYGILAESFGLTEYEAWYADISHRIRHEISTVYLYNNTTVTMQFDIDNYVFVSHIATSQKDRGKGIARNFLYYLCEQFEKNNKKMYLFALNERKSFYESIGFLPVDTDYIYELKWR